MLLLQNAYVHVFNKGNFMYKIGFVKKANFYALKKFKVELRYVLGKKNCSNKNTG